MLSKLLGLACLCALFCGGCATVVIPSAQLNDPTAVYLIDYGRTSAIVLPSDGGTMNRYAYGNWDWYALRKTEWWRAVPALLWPTRGALGRMEMASAPSTEAMVQELSQGAEAVYTISVEREKALTLSRKLDADFRQNIATKVHTPAVGLDFVHHGHWYWGFHNSNHQMAGWLHDLGVKTRGYPAWSRWVIRASAR